MPAPMQDKYEVFTNTIDNRYAVSKFNFTLPSLLCFDFLANYNLHENGRTETAKTFTDKGLTMTEDRRGQLTIGVTFAPPPLNPNVSIFSEKPPILRLYKGCSTYCEIIVAGKMEDGEELFWD
jgi:hypothetical protein